MNFEFMNKTVLGNSLLQWLIAVGALVATVILLRIIQRLAQRRMGAHADGHLAHWAQIVTEIIRHTKFLFLLVVGVFVATFFIKLPERTQNVVSDLLIIGLLIQAGIWGGVVIVSVLDSYQRRAMEENPASVTTINIIGIISKVALWAAVLLLALDNLGFNITTLVAGLGIGGVAIALAVQNVLGDLFASLAITLDKPFVIGDFLILGEHLGSVEHVGLKTTRLRSLSGEQLVFSNSDLLNSRIRNYGRMFERRVVFTLGVTYETPREKLKRIPGIIREAIEAQENTRFDRSHFSAYGDFALMFESVYYVLKPDYNVYMDVQQAIYFAIHERFEQEDISFAYPTRRLYITTIAPEPSA
ncbi:MAG: mechanosensitive ion channel family protein [Gammaproteobacteria bacterium]|jgi:small-conductance mechanosensitive channel